MIDNPRIDLLVARYGRTLVLALALVGVLALAVSGWAIATPHEETTTQEIDHETIETELHTSAVVESDGLWEEGTELTNEPVYLQESISTVTLSPQTTVPTDETDLVHDVTLRHEATRDDTVFWDRAEPLIRDEPSIAEGVASSTVEIDVAEILADQREIEDHVADVGDVATVVEIQSIYDTGSNADELVLETELVVTDRAVWLADPTPSASNPHTETELVTDSESRSVAFVGFFALLGTGALAAAWLVSRRSSVDETAARRALHERRYAEWISRGSIPMWVGEHHIALDTLEDVVDVAIDTNKRVVHDRQRGLFAAVTDDVVYYYTDRGLWEETAWPNMNLEADAESGFVPPGVGPDEEARSPLEDAASEPPADDQAVDPPTDLDPDDEDAWHRL